MTKKPIFFIPDAVDAMRAYAKDQYDRLISYDGTYEDFQVDTDVVDGMVGTVIPPKARTKIANAYGKAIWGLHPVIDSTHCDPFLPEMIRRLDAIVEWCDAGNEFDLWCEFNEVTGKIVPGIDDDE